MLTSTCNINCKIKNVNMKKNSDFLFVNFNKKKNNQLKKLKYY